MQPTEIPTLNSRPRENAALLQLLGMLAHELRNPLAPLVTAAEILQRPKVDPASVRRMGALIQRQTTHMAALLADLLDASRINNGLVVLEREPLVLHEVLAHAIEQTRPLMESRSQRFILRAPAQLLRVVGDANRLVQVFANILNNAAKYTPEGGAITLTVEPGGSWVVVRVADTGIGMSEELLAHVFEIFTQAERSVDRHVGGLGLGLSLVKDLVGLQGGTVSARSAGLGQGSEISVTFPCSRTMACGDCDACPPPMSRSPWHATRSLSGSSTRLENPGSP
jgi:signal transduction histidine kinase